MKLSGTSLSIRIMALSLCALSFNAHAEPNTTADWLPEDVSSIKSVKAYCEYLDSFIPASFRNYAGYLVALKSSTGQDNLKNAELAEQWSDRLKSSANTWGALGCTQIIYGAKQEKTR